MIAELDTTLLGLITVLIGGQSLFLKWLMSRSDKLIEHLGNAVNAFEAFEAGEDIIHAKIVESLNDIANTQLEILHLLKNGDKTA